MLISEWMVAGWVLGAYVLGSIPFGVLAAKGLGTTDPRTAGSRNIGFTNVLRVSGRTAGVLTLVGDMGKGWLVGWGASHVLEHELAVLAVTLTVIVGHVYSVFLRFRGGKGVATAIGAIVGVAPWVGLGTIVIWFVALGVFRYSSGAAVIAFALLPGLAGVMERGVAFVVFCGAVGVVIILRHKENLVKLWHGTEERVGASS